MTSYSRRTPVVVLLALTLACGTDESAVPLASAPSTPATAMAPPVPTTPAVVTPPVAPTLPVPGGAVPSGSTGTIGLGVGVGVSFGRAAPPSPGSHVETGEVTVTPAALSVEVVRRVVRRHTGEARFCHERELTSAADLAGRLAVRWAIGVDGAVSDVTLGSSVLTSNAAPDGGAPARALESCLVERIRSWIFPSPEGSPVTVEVAFAFVVVPPDAAAVVDPAAESGTPTGEGDLGLTGIGGS